MIKIIQCPYCGWVQLSTANKRFVCVRCNKSKSINKVKIIKTMNSVDKARKIVLDFRKNFKYN